MEIIKNLPYGAYEARSGVRQSFLYRMLTHTPAHARAHAQAKHKPSPEMRFGTLCHSLILEPETFDKRYQVGGPINPKTGKAFGTDTKAWEAFEAGLPPGQTIISAEDHERAKRVRDAVLEHPKVRRLLEGAEHEVSYFWTDQESGVDCKARPDAISRLGIFADLKITQDVRAFVWQKAIHERGHHFQAAFYLDGHRQVQGGKAVPWVWICAEPEEPFGVKVYEIAPRLLRQGLVEVGRALALYKTCSESNEWPGYSEDIEVIDVPKYAQDTTE